MKRRVVFVVGPGRSGTATMAGLLQTLGMHAPQAGAAGGATTDLHEELLQRCNVEVCDARPAAWYDAGKLAHLEPLRGRVHAWLSAQLEVGPEVVVHDPRLAWFVGLWRSAALRCAASPAYVTMLSPPAELVTGSQRSHANRSGTTRSTAAWVNMVLHTERATRGSARAFVRRADLVRDWTVPVAEVGQAFDLTAVQTAQANDIRAGHAFVGTEQQPTAQRPWEDVAVPPRLRELAEESWRQLDVLAEAGGDVPDVHDRLDELRVAYTAFYEEAEAVSQSTARAARREGMSAASAGPAPAAAAVRRGADRVPHQVRAMVPAPARRGLRRALGRERPEG